MSRITEPRRSVVAQCGFKISIPEGLEQLSRNYLANRQKEVLRMSGFASGQGLDELRTFGHNMKGNGTPYGFPELARLGATIETAARTSDIAQLAESLSEVKEYLNYAEKVLSAA